ncbi:uncharacterized protein LOC113357872 [Papaver somniferum]|uniref:uncharacterized protein LOC113357872 n=1 Tax=Papaver somniferum TaxID=3469 RepID=UPI000E6FD99E|nr:uncharacterized protein LOC113357872 [Papaver somniferum]
MQILSKPLRAASQVQNFLVRSIQDNIMLAHEQLRNYHRDSGAPRCKYPIVTHLCFADDRMVFMNGDVQTATSFATTLNIFSAITCLVVNNIKSNIFMSSLDSVTAYGIKTVLGFQVGSLPVKYLGLPLLSTRLSDSDCLPLTDHVLARIKSWKASVLSYAGRVLLVKAILSSMLIFWTSFFVLPKKIINFLNSIFRNFLWDGIELIYKQPVVSWTIIFHPYKEGGLGII